MPRVARSRLWIAPIALVALAVGSCFTDPSDCPTCPAVDSGRIVVELKADGLVDSVHVRIDGGPVGTVIRNQIRTFGNLSAGDHEVSIVRWFSIDDVLTFRTSILRIRLERGESRSITFHNDLPQVSWAPMPEVGPLPGLRQHDPIALRVG